MHDVGGARGKVESGVFGHRKRIHVTAQHHRRARLAAGEQSGDSARRFVQGDVEGQILECTEYGLAGGRKVVADLGSFVQPPTQCGGTVVKVRHVIAQLPTGTVTVEGVAGGRIAGHTESYVARPVAIPEGRPAGDDGYARGRSMQRSRSC